MALWCWAFTWTVSSLFAPELDFGVLPAANTTQGYQFTVMIELSGKEAVVLPFAVGRVANPRGVADLFEDSLADHSWLMKRNGLRKTLLSHDKAQVIRITVQGKGPKPLVRLGLRDATPDK